MSVEVEFGPDGLVPVVVQDAGDGAVLMLGYANAEAIARTLAERRAWFWSRSRQAFWRKGETSGNTLEVLDVRADCDRDAVLYRVRAHGPACHTGKRSCFHFAEDGSVVEPPAADVLGGVLTALAATIRDRHLRNPENSYVAGLLRLGAARVAQKVGEEGVEVALSSLAEPHDRQVSEVADLLFHTLVLMESVGIEADEVAAELRGRVR
ncbi:MAG TPA: bifunctional phosphoribosyl-AMP cyclohydrolase/phosphoribosyl-ATP diphosphatase HisIE [Bacillota bacterium]|nr:bifunctional phosphoribosyl-AMP cyclohydrolase/phosphoribosyl-ATP diphosphatase HisIE [Bacillota bacterium]